MAPHIIVPDERRCTATAKSGERCPAPRWRGSENYCYPHDPEIDEAVRQAHRKKGGAPKKPRLYDALEIALEQRADQIVGVYLDAIQAYETAKHQGVVSASDIAAHETRLKAVEALLTRVFGSPTSRSEVSGPDGGPMKTQVDPGSERVRKLANELLEAASSPGDAE